MRSGMSLRIVGISLERNIDSVGAKLLSTNGWLGWIDENYEKIYLL